MYDFARFIRLMGNNQHEASAITDIWSCITYLAVMICSKVTNQIYVNR